MRVAWCLPWTVPGELTAGGTSLSVGQGDPASLGMVVRPELVDPNIFFCVFMSLKSLWQSTNYKNSPASWREKMEFKMLSGLLPLPFVQIAQGKNLGGGVQGRRSPMACRLLL